MSKKIIKSAKVFEGKADYDKSSLLHLFRATDNVYHMRKLLLRFAVGLLLAITGAIVPLPVILKVLFMMVGGWLLGSRDFSARMRAVTTLEQRKAVLPTITTVFDQEDIILDGEGCMHISYSKIRQLFSDRDYYFLFLSEQSACMIQRSSLRPDSEQEFRKFTEEKTGLKWQEYKSFLQMNLEDVKRAFDRERCDRNSADKGQFTI